MSTLKQFRSIQKWTFICFHFVVDIYVVSYKVFIYYTSPWQKHKTTIMLIFSVFSRNAEWFLLKFYDIWHEFSWMVKIWFFCPYHHYVQLITTMPKFCNYKNMNTFRNCIIHQEIKRVSRALTNCITVLLDCRKR